MKFNFRKIKHLYLLYGISNTLLIFGVLVVVFFLYSRFERLENHIGQMNKEILNVYDYKVKSSNYAHKNILSDEFYDELGDTETNDFIKKIENSREIIQIIIDANITSDVYFTEKIHGLYLDYNELIKQNKLLFKYLHELGGEKKGLYYKFLLSASDFEGKLSKIQNNKTIMKEYNFMMQSVDLFLNSRNADLAFNIQKQVKKIKSLLDELPVNDDNYMVVRVKDSFSNFETNYFEFARKTFEIGYAGKIGLLSKLLIRCKQIELRLKQAIDVIETKKRQTKQMVYIVTALVALIIILYNLIVTNYFNISTKRFIQHLEIHVEGLQKGTINKLDRTKLPVETHDLLSELEAFSYKLINAADIAKQLASGRTSFELKKEDLFEVFYTNLSGVKSNIEDLNKKVREERKKQTNLLWIKSGIDKLTEVMRKEYDNPVLHSNEIINMLVRFLNIPIGAIYYIKEEGGERFAEMMASFAYGKEKQLYKKIAMGEGVVGTAASEKKTLNITSIPDGYFNIISGFGEAKPKNILVSPIKLNENIYGIIELASLSRFKQEEIAFVEEVCKTVAYSFALSKVYLDTLFKFESVNMEVAELEAENASLTNDYEELNESYKAVLERTSDNEFLVKRFNEISMIIEVDLDGNIIEINDVFEQFFKSAKVKFLHTNFKEYFTTINLSPNIDLENVWREIRTGLKYEINQKVNIADQEFWLNQHFFPLTDNIGRVKKVKVVLFDLTSKYEALTDKVQL